MDVHLFPSDDPGDVLDRVLLVRSIRGCVSEVGEDALAVEFARARLVTVVKATKVCRKVNILRQKGKERH